MNNLELFLIFTAAGHLLCAAYIFFKGGALKWVITALILGLIGVIICHIKGAVAPDSGEGPNLRLPPL